MTDSSQQPHAHAFARLPDELLLGILDHIDRPLASLTDKERLERRKTLYALCLVSKRFYEVAQPVLWRQMELQPSRTRRWDQQALDRAVAAMQAAPDSAKAVKTLWVRDWRGHEPIRLGKAIELLPNVEDVKIRDLSTVYLSEISNFSKLLRLDAVERIFARLSTPVDVSFLHLTTLNFHSVGLDLYPLGESIYAPATMPALRHLSLRACTETKSDWAGREAYSYFPVLPRALVDRLEDLQLDFRDRPAISTYTLPSYCDAEIPPVLFHVDVYLASADSRRVAYPPVHFLQVTPPNTSRSTPHFDIQAFAFCPSLTLEQLPRLRLVLVPSSLWPSDPEEQAAGVIALEAEMLAWRMRGVEVRTYDPSRPLDGLVVPEFREYLREKAAGTGA